MVFVSCSFMVTNRKLLACVSIRSTVDFRSTIVTHFPPMTVSARLTLLDAGHYTSEFQFGFLFFIKSEI